MSQQWATRSTVLRDPSILVDFEVRAELLLRSIESGESAPAVELPHADRREMQDDSWPTYLC